MGNSQRRYINSVVLEDFNREYIHLLERFANYPPAANLESYLKSFRELLDAVLGVVLINQEGLLNIDPAEEPTLSNLHSALGVFAVNQGKWYEGLRFLEKSLELRREMDDLDGRAGTIYHIGRVHQLLSNFDEARTRYRDALRLYERTENEEGIAACKAGLGSLAIQQGMIDEGMRLLEEARQYYEEEGEDERVTEIDEILNVVEGAREKALA